MYAEVDPGLDSQAVCIMFWYANCLHQLTLHEAIFRNNFFNSLRTFLVLLFPGTCAGIGLG